MWRGRIYTTSKFGVLLRRPIIYRGQFGSAGFQFLYAAPPAVTLMLCTTFEYHILVTLPLWILSVIFHHLFPLAVTSLAVSLGVCVAAGYQAALPRSKTRPWSRPLVALLFFLQPILRGWARYQGRLLPPSAWSAARQTLDSVALQESTQHLNQADYWSQTPLNRLAYVAEILRRMEQQGWLAKSDIGWSDFDVEIYGGRWSQLQLATVAEDHAQGRHLLRCRLQTHWSLQAKATFWALLGAQVLVLGLLAARWPWLYLLLLSVPLFTWFLHRQGRKLQSTTIVFLDQLAKDLSLTKLRPESNQDSREQSGAGPTPAPAARQQTVAQPSQSTVH